MNIKNINQGKSNASLNELRHYARSGNATVPKVCKSRYKANRHSSAAFTIVELLVVIVIIGILAAITIVSYSGISNKAIAVSLQSDLDNDAKLLRMYNVEHGYYPDAPLDANNCPSNPTPDTRYCLKASTGTTLTYTGGGQIFTLTASKSGQVYRVTDAQSPFSVTPTPITAIAAITGTLQISQILTAGALTPAGATASYQWQSATTSGGTYTNIPGATSSTYAVLPSDINKYLKVVATGTGIYTGAQTSTATGSAIAADPNWITIGTQTWAKTNLNVGTMVTGVTAQTNNGGTNVVEKYCYNNDEANCTTYGGLYQWDEAMRYTNAEKAQGICPAGSHIPSDAEWKTLEMSLSGMSQATADTTGWRGTDEGTKLKPGGSSGLNMPLAGYRSTVGSFNSLSSHAYLWSSSESSTSAWNRYLNSGVATVNRNTNVKADGSSVRCLGN